MTLITLTYSDREINLLLHRKENGFVANQAELEKGIVEKGIIIDTEKFSKVLTNIVKNKFKIRSQVVFHCAIPEEKSYIQIIQIPIVPEDKIKQAIRWQSKSLLTFDIENVYIDTQIISRSVNRLKVLITATPKILINNLIESIKQSKYQLERIDTRSGALARLFATTPHELVVLSEIHDKKATVILAKNGIARLSSITRLTENDRPFVGKVKELIEYYTHRKEKDKKINKLYIIGNIEKNDIEQWEKSFNLEIIKPSFASISGLGKSDISDKFIANYGLEKDSIQKVNLLPQKVVNEYEKNNNLLQVRHILGFMSFLMVLLSLINVYFIFDVENKISDSRGKTIQVNKSTSTQINAQDINKLSKTVEQVKDITITFNQSALLKAILDNEIQGFDLTEVDITNHQGTIKGIVDSRSTMLKIAQLLETNKLFKSIFIPVASYGASSDSSVEIKFDSK